MILLSIQVKGGMSMSNVVKAYKFEMALIKPYMKSIMFSLIVPIAFVFINRSLSSSISFAMCFISMTSSYTFSVAEKNDMDRLYGILPVTKKEFVFGKYMYMIVIGVLALIFSLITHTIVLRCISIEPMMTEIVFNGGMGLFMFSLYTTFQIPGYYKYGPIKGRAFMYIPVLGFLVTLFGVQKIDAYTLERISALLSNRMVVIGLVVGLIVIMYALSVRCSIRILKNKEI